MSEQQMKHQFTKSTNRLSNNPLKDYWECLNCDSGVLIPKGYTSAQVNQFMTSKMPCLPPIDKPQDGIIDNRTTILKQKTHHIELDLRKNKPKK